MAQSKSSKTTRSDGQASNQFVTECLDAVLKGPRVICFPVGTASRNGIISHKPNVQHIVLVVAVVSADIVIGKAKLRQRNGRFTGRSQAVSIAPDAVEL